MLKWQLEHGDTWTPEIIDAMEGRGQDLPKAYQERPIICPFFSWYWESFQELTTCRQVEMGRIPWTSINEYAIRHNISDFEFFLRIIRSMDNIFIDCLSKKREREMKKKK